jgi:UDP-N-acetyl-2-amino-2-deoxyglucuronate dehydrogenase
MLLWLFGEVEHVEVSLRGPRRMAGQLELQRARVEWFLSVDHADLPSPAPTAVHTTHRSITIDGVELEFTDGFADLHTRVYERTLAGAGFGIEDARSSIELVHRIRTLPVKSAQSLGVQGAVSSRGAAPDPAAVEAPVSRR